MKLYEITNDYLRVLENIEIDQETGEILNASELDVQEKFEDKAINVTKYFLDLDSEVKAIREAESMMKARRERLQKKSESLKKYLKDNMELCKVNKLKCEYFEVKIAKNPPSVVILDESEIPYNYRITEMVSKIDKFAIKDAIKQGKDIPGVKLESGTKLVVK